MRRSKRFWLVALVTLLLLTTAGVLALPAIQALPMATGYIAKTLCSEYFVAGRQDLERVWSDVVDIDSLFELGGYDLDTDSRRVTGRMGIGFPSATAVYRHGLGCTLARDIEPGQLQAIRQARVPAASPLPAAPPDPGLEAVLDEAFSEPSPGSHRQTRAVVILQHGRIVAERYATGFSRETPLIGWSMTKSITNNLVALLVADGVLDRNMAAPVPEWQQPGDARGAISLAQLLQMSSGLDFDETYAPGSDATDMLFASFSAAAVAAAAPLAHEPGSHWSYSSGTSNILARIVRDAVGGSEQAIYDFIHSRLYTPLGITSMVIEPDASGSPVGSSFSYATARDWARLGQFWLQDGTWNGKRLLPAGWMEWSTAPAPAAPRGEYGAQFWLNAGKDGKNHAYPGLPTNAYFANGFNDQVIGVFPDQQTVVVRLGFTTDNSWDTVYFMNAVLAALE
jgi:CubicO group peptidase (beta-lactamase class C family)